MTEFFAIDVAHTPGINYALAYWISCMVYSAVLPLREIERWTRALYSLALLVGLGAFMTLTDGINKLFFVPCILLDVGMMLAYMYGSCNISLKKAVYFLPRVFMLGEFAAAFEWQVYYYLNRNAAVSGSLLQAVMLLLFVYAAVFSIGYFLERRYREANEQMSVSGNQLLALLVLTVSIYVVSNLSFISINTPFSGSSVSEIFIIRSLVDLGGVGILFAMHMQNQNLSTRVRADYLQKLLTMQYDNYRIHEESVKLVNQKYHDLKHQIALLRSEITATEKLKFLDEMEKDIRSYEAQNKTGNGYLDTVLTARSLQCQHDGISLTCTADGSVLKFMSAMDVSILFGNALDNAIESVSKLEDRTKRLIHLTVNRQKDFVRIHLENCFEGELQIVNGVPVTTKGDTNFHGFGLQSIRTIVDKYGGSMTVHAENGWFELRILFTVPEGE